jgi:predicted ArsR family transcriptional regulator
MVASQEHSTRTTILDFLKTHADSEVKTIAEFCGLTTVAVRRHLLRLHAGGLVQARTERRPQGRPAALYSLSGLGDAQFPRDYSGFASDVLSALVVLDGEAKIKEVFRKRRRTLSARYAARFKGKSFKDRVHEMAAVLTECGYMAEAASFGPGAYVLTEHNCAIPDIAKCFPAACEEELRFIRDLVGGEVKRVTHRLAGDRHCSYLLKEKREPGRRTSHRM